MQRSVYGIFIVSNNGINEKVVRHSKKGDVRKTDRPISNSVKLRFFLRHANK